VEPKDLKNARAAWVDPWSAAGFIIPRLWLLSNGIDPRTLFRAESFKWSHKAAVQAVVDGAADVAGTYASLDAGGAMTSGGWSTIPEAKVRVLQKLGAVPPDLIAHADTLSTSAVEAITRALVDVKEDQALALACQELFQATEFAPAAESDYDALAKELEAGEKKDLFAG
jgi:ABC-type phosphate/phosphonate transport system substrate-binding protein